MSTATIAATTDLSLCTDENGMVQAEPHYPTFHAAPGHHAHAKPRTTPLGGEPLPKHVDLPISIEQEELQNATVLGASLLLLMVGACLMMVPVGSWLGGMF